MVDEIDASSGYDVKYMRMELTIDPAVLYLSGNVNTTIEARTDINEARMQLIRDFTIQSIKYQGQEVQFTHTDPFDLTILFPTTLTAGNTAEIEITYSGTPSTAQGFGSVGIGQHEGVPVFWTLSEPYGARDWWPGKNDLTDKIDSLDVIVHSPQAYRTASNGLLISDTVIGTERTNHWKHRYPIVPYLVAVAVTNYAVYVDSAWSAGKFVPVVNYVYPEDLEEIRPRTENTPPLIDLYTELFIPYPFSDEKYGHAQFGWGGGMEHQTMSFMGRFDFEIIAHELAHQWFGDMVTLNSWHDIWLNEGFATYLTGLAYEHMFDGFYWYRWKRLTLNFVTLLPGGSVYVADTANVNRIFDSRLSYRKGALVLHSLRWIVGDTAFFDACKSYLTDPLAAYGFASTDMLKFYMETASGKDLTEFFDDWYYGEGFPSYVLDVTSTEDQKYNVSLSQTTSHPSVDFFEMPVPVTFYGPQFDTTIVFDHQQNGQSWVIDIGFTPDSIVIDPEIWLITANNQVLLDSSEPMPYPSASLHPNPAYDYVKVNFPYENPAYSISDSKGNIIIASRKFNPLEWIDVSQLRKGTYFIRLTSDKYSATQKLIKL